MTTPDSPARPKPGVRADIQGLRAVAVLLVLLFHAHLGLSGGYIGVDVFFVVSGYLITGLLLREEERTGTVSLTDFYARRIKRLAPMFVLTVGVTLVLVVTTLTPRMRLQVLPQLSWSLIGAANVHFARVGGDYFATREPDLLLHAWSLAVEEQFYLVWPVAVLAVAWVRRWPVRRLMAVLLVVGGGISLALSAYLTPRQAAMSFYLPHTRAWELAAGGLLALVPAAVFAGWRGPARALLALGGMAAIVVPAFAYTESTGFPGLAAGVPVLGTVALLAAGTGGDLPGLRFHLGNPVLTSIGDLSYSLYLVHLPILVWPPLLRGEEMGWAARAGLAAAAVLVAAVTHRLIERPLHRWDHRGRVWRVYAVGATASIVVLALTVAAQVSTRQLLQGAAFQNARPIGLVAALDATPAKYVQRHLDVGVTPDGDVVREPVLTPPIAEVDKDRADIFGDCVPTTWSADPVSCTFGPEGSPTVALVGDSHAGQWFPALKGLADTGQIRLVTYVKNACPVPFLGINRHPRFKGTFPCAQWQANAWRQVQRLAPDLIVLGSQDWGYATFPGLPRDEAYIDAWFRGMQRTLAQVPKESRLLLIADNPIGRTDPIECLSANLRNPTACDVPRVSISQRLAEGQARMVTDAGGSVIDLPALLCDGDQCPITFANRIVYRDVSHLTVGMTRLTTPYFAWVVDETLAGRSQVWPGP